MAANNNTFLMAIPASTALASPASAGAAQDANQLRTIGDVTNCLREMKCRKVLKANELPALTAVTSNEVSCSFIHQVAVAAEVAAGTYGPLPGTPLWAQQMQQAVQQAVQQAQQHTQQTLQTGFNKQEACSNNLEARLFNRDIREGHIPLHPLYKVRAVTKMPSQLLRAPTSPLSAQLLLSVQCIRSPQSIWMLWAT